MAGADRLDLAHRRHHRLGRLLIDIAAVHGALGEGTAGVGRGIQHGDAARSGEREQRFGVAIDERQAVVGDQHVEVEVAQQRHHHVDPPGGEADGGGEALLLDPHQRLDRSALAGDLGEVGRILRIVEVEDVDAVDAERREARLERPPRHRAIEAVVVVAVELGREHPPRRPAAPLAHDHADPLLAAAVAVVARGVEEAVGQVEDRPHRRQRPLLADLVAVGVGHVAEARCPEADRRHREPRPADRAPVRHPFLPLL